MCQIQRSLSKRKQKLACVGVSKSFAIEVHMNASHPAEEERSFFKKEREQLSNEISRVGKGLLASYRLLIEQCSTQDFEELISSTNMLNRKLEDVVGMRKEIDPIADLWSSFYQLMKEQKPDVEFGQDGQGMPGTGGHVVTGKGTAH